MAEYSVDAIKKAMDANSAAWFTASAADKEKIHSDNVYLAALLGGSSSNYNATTGVWSIPSSGTTHTTVQGAGTTAQTPTQGYQSAPNPFPQLPVPLNIDASNPITKDNVSKYAQYGLAGVVILLVISMFRG